MKKIGRALFCAACLSLLAASLYAAPKAKAPKDIWVAKEKNGMLVTTDANGWAQVDFGEEVDLSGYKYLQVECSSPDGKKFSHIELSFGFVPEENEDYDWDESAKIRIYDIQKKPALYQGIVYGPNMCYEHWENGKKIATRDLGYNYYQGSVASARENSTRRMAARNPLYFDKLR